MSYSALRVFALQASFQRVVQRRREASNSVKAPLQVSQLEPQKVQVEAIFEDAFELNSAQAQHSAFGQDLQRWESLQQQLGAPLKAQSELSFAQELIEAFKRATEQKIGFAGNKLQFIQQQLKEILHAHPAYLYLELIIDFYTSGAQSGVQYLIEHFRRTPDLQKTLTTEVSDAAVSQAGYNHSVQRSYFQKVFTDFLQGKITQNDPNLSEEAQQLILDLNALVRANYSGAQFTASLETSQARLTQSRLTSSQNGQLTRLMQSQTVFEAERDQFYQILQQFLAGEPTSVPFVVQAFFDVVRPTPNTRYSAVGNTANGAATNARLFVRALRGEYTQMFQEMQQSGLYLEFFVLSYFFQDLFQREFYVPKTVDEVELRLIEDVLAGNLSSSQNQAVLVANCFCAALSGLQQLLGDCDPTLFGVGQLGIVFDVVAAFVQYKQIQNGEPLKVKSQAQLYVEAMFLEAGQKPKDAFQILMELSGKFEYKVDMLVRLAQKLTLQVLFNPADVFWLQDCILQLEPRTEYQKTQQIFCRDLLDVVRAYHANDNLKQALERLDAAKLEVMGQVFVEEFNTLARFLILCAIKANHKKREIQMFVSKFELNQECRKLLPELMK